MKTLSTGKDDAAIKNCNEEWENIISSKKDEQNKEVNACKKRWEDKRSSLISKLVAETTFEDYEISWLFYHNPKSSSSMPSNSSQIVPARVLKDVIEGNSNNISKWVMYKIPADTHYKIFWWSIPICLIAWIWIPKAWIGILIALVASIVRNTVLESRSEKDYQSELSFHKFEIEKFNQMASHLSQNVIKLKSSMDAEISQLKSRHKSDENELKLRRDKELDAINNGIVTKYTSKSFGCGPHAKIIKMLQ